MSDTDTLLDAVSSPSTANITGSMHDAARIEPLPVKRRRTTHWKSVRPKGNTLTVESRRRTEPHHCALSGIGTATVSATVGNAAQDRVFRVKHGGVA